MTASLSPQLITPFLWFDQQAEEAAKYYTSIFPNSGVKTVTRYTKAGPLAEGTVLTVNFQLDGQDFTALNGGPHYRFSPATSFVVHCRTQQDLDRYWDALLDGGKPQQCGWLDDRFGVTWQVVPERLLEMIQDKDAARVLRVTEAMMKMVKLDIPTLEKAWQG